MSPAASLIVSIVSATIACCSLAFTLLSFAASRRGQMGETIAWCLKTYYEMRAGIPTPGDAEATRKYFEALWGLQLVEYHYCRYRLLPEDLFALWLVVRHREYYQSTHGLDFKAGWEGQRPNLVDKHFVELVDAVLALPANTPNMARLAQEEAHKRLPSLWRQRLNLIR